MKKITECRPRAYHYTDYRKYIEDLIIYKKANFEYFSYRSFAKKAGYTSSSILKEVLSGRRNIPKRRIADFVRALSIKGKEAEYFRAMVGYNDEPDQLEKTKLFRALLGMKRRPTEHRIAPNEADFYNHWYHAAIRELVNLDGFRMDAKWIANKLRPRITEVQARNALSVLQALGYVCRDKRHVFRQHAQKLDADPEMTGEAVRAFNSDMARMGLEAVERYEPALREVSGVTMSVPADCVDDIKEMIRKFKDHLMEFVCRRTGQPDTVYQFNVQFFPLTGSDDE